MPSQLRESEISRKVFFFLLLLFKLLFYLSTNAVTCRKKRKLFVDSFEIRITNSYRRVTLFPTCSHSHSFLKISLYVFSTFFFLLAKCWFGFTQCLWKTLKQIKKCLPVIMWAIISHLHRQKAFVLKGVTVADKYLREQCRTALTQCNTQYTYTVTHGYTVR